MGKKQVRRLAPSFVAHPPAGTSTETRLTVTDAEDALLWDLHDFGGRLRNRDLRFLVELKAVDNGDKDERRKVLAARRRNLTGEYSGRLASAVCQANVDEWQLAKRNLVANRRSLLVRIEVIANRLKAGVGDETSQGVKGYPNNRTARLKRNKLNHLNQKLGAVDAKLDNNRLSICRGSAALARKRHNLEAAAMTVERWNHDWRVARGWFAAIGSTGERFGNDTINVNPHDGAVEIMLPPDKAEESNTPGRRRTLRLASPAGFKHLETEWRTRAETCRAVRYEIAYKHSRRNKAGGWYLKASWARNPVRIPSLDELRRHRTFAVDMNADHLACYVIEPDGNPVGCPITIPVDCAEMSTSRTDAYIRDIVGEIAATAHKHGCASVTVENLGFADARDRGKEWQQSTRQFRRTVHGMPTAVLRDRLVSMLYNLDDPIWVIAVDPAYTSVLGRTHWLQILKESYNTTCTSHHAAAVVIGRRGMGFVARRRLGIHESEQKSRRECFSRRSIRPCGADETSDTCVGDQTNDANEPCLQREPKEPRRLPSVQRTRLTGLPRKPGEDKQFTSPQRLVRDKHPHKT